MLPLLITLIAVIVLVSWDILNDGGTSTPNES